MYQKIRLHHCHEGWLARGCGATDKFLASVGVPYSQDDIHGGLDRIEDFSAGPELSEIEGFVVADDLIVANWLRGTGPWYVDTDAPSSRWSMYRDIAGHAATRSVIAHPTPSGRLPAMAAYLEIPWMWFATRCREVAAAGADGLAHPRSRLVSTEGLMTALRYVANFTQSQNP